MFTTRFLLLPVLLLALASPAHAGPSVQGAPCRHRCLAHYTGRGTFLRALHNGVQDMPAWQTFLAPAHFVVRWSVRCDGHHQLAIALLDQDGQQQVVTYQKAPTAKHGRHLIDSSGTLRYAVWLRGTGCAWDVEADRL